MGNIGIWQLLLVVLLVVLVFGSRKLRNLGEDIGVALKNFKKETNKKNSSDKNSDDL